MPTTGLVRLEWDSEFFGLSIARAVIEERTVSEAVAEAAASGVQCLYLVIPGAHPSTVTDATRCGGRLVDLRLTLDRHAKPPRSPPTTRLGEENDLPELMSLARLLSQSSRFNLDPCFSPESVGVMYEIWLERCMREGVVVVPRASVGGFVAARHCDGGMSIDLVYVDRESRGKGLAAQLVRGALASSEQHRARVATQAWNIAGQRLYQEIGFRTSSLTAIVHVWLDDAHQMSEARAAETGERLSRPSISEPTT